MKQTCKKRNKTPAKQKKIFFFCLQGVVLAVRIGLLKASLKLQHMLEHFCSVFVSVMRAKLLKIVTKLVKTLVTY